MYQAKQTARGAGIMPKRELDFMKCEVMRFYRLSAMILEPVAMTVPRKVSIIVRGEGRGGEASTHVPLDTMG